MATTDPQRLPEKATWFLVTNLPHPDSELATESELAPSHLWGEQSYKQVKHVLEWSDYQGRSDLSIRRHWLGTGKVGTAQVGRGAVGKRQIDLPQVRCAMDQLQCKPL